MGRSDHDGETAETAAPCRTVEGLQRELDALRESSEVLRASDATVRAVLELTDASVFAKDLDGRYVLVNRPS